MTRVEVHIEEFVLHGFPAVDRDGIAEAVRAELTQRLAGAGARDGLAGLGGVPIERIDAGSLHVHDPSRPARVGSQIGGAVAGALTGGKP